MATERAVVRAVALLCVALSFSCAAAARLAKPLCPPLLQVTKRMSRTYKLQILPNVSVESINNAATILEFVSVDTYGNVSSSVARAPYSKKTTLKFPGAYEIGGIGINSKGVVVGAFSNSSTSAYSFAFVSNGSYRNSAGYTVYNNPSPLNDQGTVFTSINDKNAVIGYYLDSHGFAQGFTYSLNTKIWTPLVPAYNMSLRPYGINNMGVIAGYAKCYIGQSHQTYGFRYAKGVFTYFQIFGYRTYVFDVNSNGDLVGGCNGTLGFVVANLTTSPKVFTFQVDGQPTDINGINDHGTIAGIYDPAVSDVYGNSYGFVGVQK